MSTAYGYGRISTDEEMQVYSPSVQRIIAREYFDRKLAPQGMQWGEMFFDSDISGGSPMLERQAGRALGLAVERGDHIIFPKLDRAFRSDTDGVIMAEVMRSRGVALHYLDMNIDTSTPEGQMQFHMLLMFAQYERQRISTRIRDAKRYRKQLELPTNGKAPLGWKVQGHKQNAVYVQDEDERRTCLYIVQLRDEERLSFQEIVTLLRQQGHVCKPRFDKRHQERSWKYNRVWAGYYAAKQDFPLKPVRHKEQFGARQRTSTAGVFHPVCGLYGIAEEKPTNGKQWQWYDKYPELREQKQAAKPAHSA